MDNTGENSRLYGRFSSSVKIVLARRRRSRKRGKELAHPRFSIVAKRLVPLVSAAARRPECVSAADSANRLGRRTRISRQVVRPRPAAGRNPGAPCRDGRRMQA